MPPRTKKAAATPGKKTTRTSRTPAKSDDVKNEVLRVEINDDNVKVSEQNYSIDSSTDLNVEPLSESNGSFLLTKEDEVKEDEYEKDERLDLEDNEPEYEPEEYGDGYDEKEVDQEDFQEEEDEVVEEVEEGDLVEEEEEEEEGDMAEEDMEEVPEELEAEEDDEHTDAGEGHGHELEHKHEIDHGHEHAELFDAAEEREHHELVKERRKRKEFEVFVGGLDKDATEEDLKEVFSVVGEVTEVRLMMNPQTKKNKGFAFLRFATVEQAKRAVLELKNPVVNGKQCGVTPSQDSDTLFLGNICKTWTKEKLKEKLKLYGIENIEDLTLVEDSNNEGKNRGFAFLEFSSRSEAMDAFKRLQKRDVLLGVERPAKVSFADSFIDPGDEIMAQVKTVFIDGLPASWDEDRVRILLKSFGEIEKVELARNMPSARRKDFGFVSFDSHDAAVTCAKSINNVELGEGDHKAKVRARLSRPLQRGKGKNHPRSDHKGGRVAGRRPRAPWNRPLPRPLPPRVRGLASRAPIAVGRGLKRPARARPLPPPPRPYDRRAPAPPPPKSSLKRDYIRREELPPRSRAVAEYGSRLPPERRPTYRDEYAARSPVYADVHRSSASRSATRRPYPEDSYAPRYERPPPSYREGRPRDYDSVSGSKRPYSAMDDVPSRYTDPGHSIRHSRARVDYDIPSGSSQYADTYGDRMGRSTAGYSGSSRSSISAQDSHGIYSSRQGMSYNVSCTIGSYGGNDGGMYSSSYGSEYPSRGSDVGGSSYSSLYSGRGVSGSGYMGGGSSGSYY
ncbi:heterogeneous nuclear ribonucleoprotein Q-like isoform X1 [Chenopodium quinoa]|uniref:heterogeneous nuclear ribonucleoprotein Q-like isoform X1 n=1 Tax=Chenopodium quinoa TaxID=63459 RepID=UPI000B787EB8|nr:heterogeneous nuclear ribonucleoprotein Q-like isoform X1 [Chenopodium quinoa]